MADVITRLSDAIEPSVFLPYMIQRTAEKSRFVQSGIVQRTPEFDALAASVGGTKSGGNITMPFWTDLSGAEDILSATGTSQDSGKIDGTAKDIACKQGRRKKWAVNDLVKFLVDSADPLTIIGDLMGDYWARRDQALLISVLKGVFAAASMSTNLNAIMAEASADVTDATKLTGVTFLDTLQKLGDNKNLLGAVAMHSATETALAKRDLIDYVPESESKAQIPVFMGRRVIVDDGLPVRAGTGVGTPNVYRTYVFAQGALAHGEQNLEAVPVVGGFGSFGAEIARDANATDSYVHFRRLFLMHPRGIKWVGTAAGEFPTNTELEVGTNWTKVYETKNIRMVAVDHNN